jgi:uncharacterized damage-inducible protein DinB
VNRQNMLQMLDYNYWATHRLVAAAKRASEEQLRTPSAVSGQSVHSTLVHIMDGERLWRLRCEGESPNSLLESADYATFEDVLNALAEQERAFRGYVAGLSDSDLSDVVHYRNTKGVAYEQVRWQILAHVINHGTQHRAEIAFLLTEMGYSPGDLDLIVYLRERS